MAHVPNKSQRFRAMTGKIELNPNTSDTEASAGNDSVNHGYLPTERNSFAVFCSAFDRFFSMMSDVRTQVTSSMGLMFCTLPDTPSDYPCRQ
jgi:hypothetical protein